MAAIRGHPVVHALYLSMRSGCVCVHICIHCVPLYADNMKNCVNGVSHISWCFLESSCWGSQDSASKMHTLSAFPTCSYIAVAIQFATIWHPLSCYMLLTAHSRVTVILFPVLLVAALVSLLYGSCPCTYAVNRCMASGLHHYTIIIFIAGKTPFSVQQRP